CMQNLDFPPFTF
nr:immunoglobulin light chain junction region [Macaca mulatta]